MRGQSAFEYLMLFSFVFAILVFLTNYSQQMTERNREDIILSNAITAVNKIADNANIVYIQGKPTEMTISVYIPEMVSSINISDNRILIKVSISSGVSDIFAVSKATLQGYISPTSGMKKIKITMQ